MTPPDQNPRFRSQVRHYHRRSTNDRSNWDSWVGIDPSLARRRKKLYRKALITLTILGFIGILAAIAHQMS